MVGHVYEPIKKHHHFYSIVYPLIFRLQFHNTSTLSKPHIVDVSIAVIAMI